MKTFNNSRAVKLRCIAMDSLDPLHNPDTIICKHLEAASGETQRTAISDPHVAKISYLALVDGAWHPGR